MNVSNKTTDQLTIQEVDKAVSDLVKFYNFTFFGERGVEESVGLTFALEQLACSLGLVESLDENGDYDSADMMTGLVNTMDRSPSAKHHPQWPSIRSSLPYL